MNKLILIAAIAGVTSGAGTLVSVSASATDPNNLYGPSLKCSQTDLASASCSEIDSPITRASATGSASTLALTSFSMAESVTPFYTSSQSVESFSDSMLITGGIGSGTLNTTMQIYYATYISNAATATFEGTNVLLVAQTGIGSLSYTQTVTIPFMFGTPFQFYSNTATYAENPNSDDITEHPEVDLTVQGFSVTDQNGNPVQAQIFIDGTLVPEPGTSSLILLGFVLWVFVRRLSLTDDAACV